MSKTVSWYRDTGETIYGQMQEILIGCSHCQSCACITPPPRPDAEPRAADYFAPRRVVCPVCGYTKEWAGRSLGFDWYANRMRDSYFGLPLWLQTPCCGHIFWTYNRRHLNIIEQYVRAKLREHRRYPVSGWHSRSLVNRLPEWMIVAKHRRAVLNAIARLKAAR